MGILNRWRQFGRRYFWPHLLLGVVAAALGITQYAIGHTNKPTLFNTSSSQNYVQSAFSRLVFSHKITNYSELGFNYWQRHTLNMAIRHISLVLAFQKMNSCARPIEELRVISSLQLMQLALMRTLNGLLISDVTEQTLFAPALPIIVFIFYQVGLWYAKVGGIRAGPLFLA